MQKICKYLISYNLHIFCILFSYYFHILGPWARAQGPRRAQGPGPWGRGPWARAHGAKHMKTKYEQI